MSAMLTCKVMKDANGEPNGVIVTPRGILLYPDLLEPALMKGEKDPEKARYGLTILLPAAANLQPMIDRVTQLVGEKLGSAAKSTKVKKPFLKVTEEDQPKVFARLVAAGIEPAKYPVMLRCMAKIKPTVIGPDTQSVNDETQIYDGRFARASINFYYYDHPTGGKGVSAGLNNVQLLDQGEVIPRAAASSAKDEFEAVDTGGATSSADSLFD